MLHNISTGLGDKRVVMSKQGDLVEAESRTSIACPGGRTQPHPSLAPLWKLAHLPALKPNVSVGAGFGLREKVDLNLRADRMFYHH